EIYNSLFGNKIKIDSSLSISDKLRKAIDSTIQELKSEKKGSVVISGIQDKNYQDLILQINEKLVSNSFIPSKTILTRNGKD